MIKQLVGGLGYLSPLSGLAYIVCTLHINVLSLCLHTYTYTYMYCLQSALRKYHELNQTLPERILVFRDGVGDGQMATVLEFEIPQMIKCFSMFGEDYNV